MKKQLSEAFVYRKYDPGQVQFTKSSLNDPFYQSLAKAIAQQKGVPLADIHTVINEEVGRLQKQATDSPVLMETIANNAVESVLFKLLCITDIQTSAPKFSNVVFQRLMRYIRAENDEFFPLRGFVERRPLHNIVIEYLDNPIDFFDKSNKTLNTAAATPTGKFMFNVPFMQKLMDYANIKQLKPQGRKYTSNGGEIPDEYGYIEFLIMHELMHYSNDDFYYQNVIPKANGTIINFVGDFRTNYLLVKSGFAQLPFGLFSDAINYDRQNTYAEMYELVKKEMEKLSPNQQQEMEESLEGESNDNHEEGQQQGGQSKSDGTKPGEGKSPGDIDNNGKKIDRQMQQGGDEEGPKDPNKQSQSSQPSQPGQQPGKGRGGDAGAVDYTKVKPKYDWKALVKRFLASVSRMETSFTRPHRRAISGLEVARQTGAGAIKPGDRPADMVDANLTFVLDASGSMQHIIQNVFANAAALLKMPAFRKAEVYVIKFSGDVSIHKCNIATNKAARVNSVDEKPKTWNTTVVDAMKFNWGGGTVFDSTVTGPVLTLLARKHNVIICTDADIMWGENLPHLQSLIQKYPKQVFVVFDTRDTYLQYRQKSKVITENVTYFG
jgi:predicted metal-dependent peptidase